MKGDPPGRAKPVDDLIIIAGGIPIRTEVKSEEMNRHTHNQQQGSNPLQEPRPETPFSHIHFISV